MLWIAFYTLFKNFKLLDTLCGWKDFDERCLMEHLIKEDFSE